MFILLQYSWHIVAAEIRPPINYFTNLQQRQDASLLGEFACEGMIYRIFAELVR